MPNFYAVLLSEKLSVGSVCRISLFVPGCRAVESELTDPPTRHRPHRAPRALVPCRISCHINQNRILIAMSSGYEVVDEGHVGGREQFPSEWKTIRAVFHNFADLPSQRDIVTPSTVLKCHGLEWQIMLYPGGNDNSSEEEVFVSLFLYSRSCTNTNKIKSKSRFRVPSAGAARGGGGRFDIHSPPNDSWGFRDYAKRKDILKASKKYLVDENLTVEVDIQVMLDKPPTWTPTNTISADMLEILDSADAENADVLFEIGDGKKKTRRSRKDECQTFYALKVILSKRAPALAALADDCSPGTAIPISGVRPDIFRVLLRFIYGGEIPGKNLLKEEAHAIIKTADRFGCTGLKLAAEAEMATAGITTENTAELILFADATNCAMLKETAMDFFVKNSDEVTASEGFEQVAESPEIMREMMAAMSSGGKKRPASSDADSERDFKRMRVSTLRQKLDEKKLDVDGSKAMLISRLEVADVEARARAEAALNEEEEE